MQSLRFDNTFVRELPGDLLDDPAPRQVLGAAYSAVAPTPVTAPRLLAYSPEAAALLGLEPADAADGAFAEVFAGNRLLPGMTSFASAYGGHQFGHWAGQLGDGRAIGLGEAIGPDGRRWELQLKGAGPTPYSRGADGRAVLRSSIREFVCSEAMHHLGVPTTRALSLVATGESVLRDMFYDDHPAPEQGAVVCRMAPSFVRFGHFELPAARGDLDLLRRLLQFTIRRDFPELAGSAQDEVLIGDWFAEVARRTARMVAGWMRVGFVHGVMNTDNMSVLGLTLDYGPYGWLEDFDPDWTPNTTDAHGRRYRFGRQPQVAHWNLGCLASALAPLLSGHEALHAGMQAYADTFAACDRADTAAKLGLERCEEQDAERMRRLRALLQRGEVDMTLWFRALADLDPEQPALAPFDAAFYSPARRDAVAGELLDWLRGHAARLRADPLPESLRRARMRAANPRYVPRNYLLQQAIDRAEQGDSGGIGELLEVLRRPYEDQPGREAYAARRPEWARNRPGCSMLSCSS